MTRLRQDVRAISGRPPTVLTPVAAAVVRDGASASATAATLVADGLSEATGAIDALSGTVSGISGTLVEIDERLTALEVEP